MNIVFKALKIIDSKQKRKISFLFFLSLIASFLELLGIGIILPFLTSLVSENQIISFSFMPFEKIFNPNVFDIKIFFLVLILIVFFSKNVYLFFQLKYQSKIIYEVAENLSSKLFKIYLNLNIIDFKLKNTSSLIRNTTTEVNTFCSGYLNSFVIILTEIILLLIIITFLLFVNFKLTLISLIFLTLISLIIYLSLKKKILFLGKLRQTNEAGRLQYLTQGFGSIKDIKLSNNEYKFLNDFNIRNQNCLKSTREYFVLSNLPRLLLEFLGILTFLIIFYVLIGQSSDPKNVLPEAGVFFVAFFRMMPSANKILVSIQSLNFAKVSIDLLEKELINSQNNISKNIITNNDDFKFEKQIEIENLYFKYRDENKNYDLFNLNFKIKKGEILGLTGPSGSGKSTLVDLILGFYNPTQGSIKVDGKNINLSLSSWQNIIGYVPQSIFLIDDTIKENITLSDNSIKIDNQRLKNATEKSELNPFINNLDGKLETVVGERGSRISGGQLQRIGIARALYKKSKLLIFDEATNALDKKTEEAILQTIFELKKDYTSIIVSHDKDCLKKCDRVITLNQGKVNYE